MPNLKIKLQQVIKLFNDNNIAINEARILLSQILGISDTDFFLREDCKLTAEENNKIDEAVNKRIKNIPLAYITNCQEFYGYKFYVDQNVLIPRADSETLIDVAHKYFQRDAAINILDLGTGSGCLVISLLNEFSNATAVAVDASKDALKVAAKNARSLNVAARLILRQSNWFKEISDKFDLIIANPPYIAIDDHEIAENVKKHEPKQALFAANNGLADYQQIAKQAANFLLPNGKIILEIGYSQTQKVTEIFERENFIFLQVVKDLAAKDRVLVFSK